MSPARLATVAAIAKRLHKRLNKAVVTHWWRKYWSESQQCWLMYDGPQIPWRTAPKRSLLRNWLAKVTLEEHSWLIRHKPGIARYTRLFDYREDEWVEDVDLPSEAKLPVVREIWVGARPLGAADCIFEESADYTFSMNNYDMAEDLDLAMMLYHDPKSRSNRPMIEDPEDGHLRPVQMGDVIQTVRGSCDDLDALFMEEPDDPRQQNDFSALGTDHKWSDRFNANTELEHKMLTSRFLKGHTANSRRKADRREPYIVPAEAVTENCPVLDDLKILRLAQAQVEKLIARYPVMENRRVLLVDEARMKIEDMLSKIDFDEQGNLIKGYFVGRDEYFADREAIHLRNEEWRESQKKKREIRDRMNTPGWVVNA